MRGVASDPGTERVSPNGYLYRKLEEGKWELVHRLVAEEKLGRSLHQNEYVTFSDGDKTNVEADNIVVRLRGRTSLRRRLAQVEARITELEGIRDDIKKRLEAQDALS